MGTKQTSEATFWQMLKGGDWSEEVTKNADQQSFTSEAHDILSPDWRSTLYPPYIAVAGTVKPEWEKNKMMMNLRRKGIKRIK